MHLFEFVENTNEYYKYLDCFADFDILYKRNYNILQINEIFKTKYKLNNEIIKGIAMTITNNILTDKDEYADPFWYASQENLLCMIIYSMLILYKRSELTLENVYGILTKDCIDEIQSKMPNNDTIFLQHITLYKFMSEKVMKAVYVSLMSKIAQLMTK